MMLVETSVVDEIQRLTRIDLQHKTYDHLFASTVEELGELSRELKIAHKVYGNTYKLPDEGVKGEVVDVYICAFCLYFASGRVDEQIHVPIPQDDFASLREMVRLLNSGQFVTVTDMCIAMFERHGGIIQEFLQVASKKLAKWESNR